MNILQISGGHIRIPPKKGGSLESVIYNISKQFVLLGNNVTIIDRKYCEDESFNENIEGIQIIRVKSKIFYLLFLDKINIVKNLSGHISLPHLIRSLVNGCIYFGEVNRYIRKHGENFDIIHLHFVGIGLLLLLLNPSIRKKTIYTSHFSIRGFNPESLKIFDSLTLKLESYLIKMSGKITIVNPTYRLILIERLGLPSSTVIAIHNGVDIDEFNNTIIPVRNISDQNKIIILFVGRITAAKGVDYLIDAADKLINVMGYSNLVFQLVGPNSLNTDYEITIKDKINILKLEKYIKFSSFISRDNLIKLYQNSDIFVMPSLVESFGLVITEAMASEKPIVASCTSGAAIQINDGWNGFLVEPANKDMLADKIKYLIDNPKKRNEMGKNGRTMAKREFDWPIIAQKYLDAYLTL